MVKKSAVATAPPANRSQRKHPQEAFSPDRFAKFYLVSECAAIARCSVWSIRNEITQGRLRSRRIGRLVRVLDSDLDLWMRGLPDEASA
jgi:hypothetical protein